MIKKKGLAKNARPFFAENKIFTAISSNKV